MTQRRIATALAAAGVVLAVAATGVSAVWAGPLALLGVFPLVLCLASFGASREYTTEAKFVMCAMAIGMMAFSFFLILSVGILYAPATVALILAAGVATFPRISRLRRDER